jgi:DNA-directed RNA polymerase sigma subunit (sigma70/sigma32)
MTMAIEAEAVLQKELTPHEGHVLQLRFGIGNGKQGIDEVAARHSLTPRAVQRIERSALRKLRLATVMEARSEYARAR